MLTKFITILTKFGKKLGMHKKHKELKEELHQAMTVFLKKNLIHYGLLLLTSMVLVKISDLKVIL